MEQKLKGDLNGGLIPKPKMGPVSYKHNKTNLDEDIMQAGLEVQIAS